MIKKLIKILKNSANVQLSKPVRAYLIQFPTVLTSVATPSSTVPVPQRTPRAVPQDVIAESKINNKIFLIKFIANIVKIFCCLKSEMSPKFRAHLKSLIRKNILISIQNRLLYYRCNQKSDYRQLLPHLQLLHNCNRRLLSCFCNYNEHLSLRFGGRHSL